MAGQQQQQQQQQRVSASAPASAPPEGDISSAPQGVPEEKLPPIGDEYVSTIPGAPPMEEARLAHERYCFMCRFRPENHRFISRSQFDAVQKAYNDVMNGSIDSPMRACEAAQAKYKRIFQGTYERKMIVSELGKDREEEAGEIVDCLSREWELNSIYYHYSLRFVGDQQVNQQNALRPIQYAIMRTSHAGLFKKDPNNPAETVLSSQGLANLSKLYAIAANIVKLGKSSS